MCLICCFIGNGHVNRFSLSAKRKYVHPYLNQFRTIQLVYLLSHASSSVRLLESCHVHYPYFFAYQHANISTTLKVQPVTV